MGVKGLGRKKTNESEHFIWEDDINVPCGRIIPSEHKDSALEYNEYAVYDPKQVQKLYNHFRVFFLIFFRSRRTKYLCFVLPCQVSIRFLVAVKYDEKYDAAGYCESIRVFC